MLRVGELLATNASPDAIRRDIETGFAQGRFSSPQKAGVAYMLEGDVQFGTRVATTATIEIRTARVKQDGAEVPVSVCLDWPSWVFPS